MLGKRAALEPYDLALIHLESKPAFFARVEDISPDYKRGWWHVKLFILAMPLKVVTWIIDDDQIRGAEFTMGGTPVRIEKIQPPEEEEPENTEAPPHPQKPGAPHKQARILSLHRKAVESTEGERA